MYNWNLTDVHKGHKRTDFFGPVSCMDEMPCLFRYSSILSSSMESTGTLRHNFWNSVEHSTQIHNTQQPNDGRLPPISFYYSYFFSCWTLTFNTRSFFSRLLSLTFIYFEVTVFVVVEENLFLVRSGHEYDLISKGLCTKTTKKCVGYVLCDILS